MAAPAPRFIHRVAAAAAIVGSEPVRGKAPAAPALLLRKSSVSMLHPDEPVLDGIQLDELGADSFPTMTHAWAGFAARLYCAPPCSDAFLRELQMESCSPTKVRKKVTAKDLSRQGLLLDVARWTADQVNVWERILRQRMSQDPAFQAKVLALGKKHFKAAAAHLTNYAQALERVAAATTTDTSAAAAAPSLHRSTRFVRVEAVASPPALTALDE